jgi:hypothetical protein
MPIQLDKYIEIKKLANPERAFKRLENEFIDIMYTDHFSNSSLIMLLDVGIDPKSPEDLIWLKQLLDTVLPEIGEIDYFLTPYTPGELPT